MRVCLVSPDRSGFVNGAQTAFLEQEASGSILPLSPHPPLPRTSVSPSAQGELQAVMVCDADSAQPWERETPNNLVTSLECRQTLNPRELRWFVPITELEGSFDLNLGLGD